MTRATRPSKAMPACSPTAPRRGTAALAAAISASMLCAPLLAQTTPNAGSLLRDQTLPARPAVAVPPTAPTAPSPALVTPPTGATAATAPAPTPAAAQVSVTIQKLHFTGDTDLATASALADLAKPLLNRPATQAELFDLAEAMTAALRSAGLLIARVTLPPQDLSTGTLQINISGGRLGTAGQQNGWQLQFAPNLSTHLAAQAPRLQRLAEASAASGSYLQQANIERGVLLLNEQPGLAAQARLLPGAAPGSTQSVVDITAESATTARVGLDNSGTPAIGVAKAYASVQAANLLGMGEQFALLAQASSGTQVLLGQASAPLPGAWGATGARAQLGFTGLNYSLQTGPGATAGLSGTARQFDLGLSYPVLRRVGLSADLAMLLQQKALADHSAAGPLRSRRISALQATLDSRWQGSAWGTDDPAANTASVGLRTGQLDLSRNAADNAADAAGLRTAGSFSSLQYAASREQRLPFSSTLSASRQWSVFARLRGQASNKNLDPSEQFTLGGPNGVRGYPAGEASGDSGFIATLEARYNLAAAPGLQAFGFIDTGSIRLRSSPGIVPIVSITGNNSYALSSSGVGLRYGTSKVNAQFTVARAIGNNDGRSPTGNNADGNNSRTRAWLTLSYSL